MTSQNQPAFAWHALARHCARCLSGGGAARELAACAHHAALVLVGSCARQGHCTGERPLSFGAWPWCDVSAAASEIQPVFAWHARAHHCARCLSGEGAARELAARPSCRADCGRFMRHAGAMHRQETSLVRRAAVVRRASGGFPESAGFRVERVGAPLRSLSLRRRRSTRDCFARSPCRAYCGWFVR